MYKFLILSICAYSQSILSEPLRNSCLGIHQVARNKISFISQKNENQGLFYYAKTTNTEIFDFNIDNILNSGENLIYQANTNPHQYLLPANAKNLFIVMAKSRLEKFDALAIVIPELAPKNTHKISTRRNVTIYPNLLPSETIRRLSNGIVNICKLSL